MVLDVLGRYLLPELYESFPMPSMILIKLHMFIAGMFMAEAVRLRRMLFVVLALLAPVVSDLLNIRMDDVQVAVEALLILGMTGVLWSWQRPGFLPRLFALPRMLLSHRIFTWLGDVSYSVYLLHLLIVMPVIALLLNHFPIANHSSGARYLLTVGICMPVVYLLATLLHRKVEMRGITIGKRIIQNKAVSEKAVN